MRRSTNEKYNLKRKKRKKWDILILFSQPTCLSCITISWQICLTDNRVLKRTYKCIYYEEGNLIALITSDWLMLHHCYIKMCVQYELHLKFQSMETHGSMIFAPSLHSDQHWFIKKLCFREHALHSWQALLCLKSKHTVNKFIMYARCEKAQISRLISGNSLILKAHTHLNGSFWNTTFAQTSQCKFILKQQSLL